MTPTEYQGEPARMVWIYDITERKRIAEEIAGQRAVLEAVLENMDQGVSIFDENLRLER